MEKDFSELVQYLDERFTRIENALGTKAEKSDVDKLFTAVDAYAKKADAYFQEMVMLSHKIERHEKWFQQIADKLEIKLEY